jgi:hypothetical protein
MAALYTCLRILVLESAFLDIAGKPRPQLGIDSIRIGVVGAGCSVPESITVHGKSAAKSMVEIGVGDRVLAQGQTGSNGLFAIAANIPLRAKRVWARDQSGRKPENFRVEANIPWGFRFEPAWAFWLSDIGGLWITAETLPYEAFAIGLPGDTAGFANVVADGDGVLDALVRFFGDAPSEITLIPARQIQSYGPIMLKVARARLDSLPLSRIVRITLPPRSALDSLALRTETTKASERKAIRESYPLLLKAISAEVEFEVRLPVGHPYLKAYAAGLISPETFFERTVGRFGGEANPLFLSEADTRPSGSRFQGTGSDDYTVLETSTALLRSDTASAAVHGKLSMLVGSNLSLSGTWENSPTPSLGSVPILTAKDSLIVNLNGRKLGWLSNSLPSYSDEARAVWVGGHDWNDTAKGRPVSGPSGLDVGKGQSFALGFKDLEGLDALKERLERLRNSGKGDGAISRRDFLASFEERNSGGLAARFWRTLLELIPFLWAFWMISRRSGKENPLWRPLLAMGIFYALWTCRDLLWFLEVGCYRLAVWRQFFWSLAHRSSLPRPDLLWSSGLLSGEVFWLFFLVLIGSAPFYFKGLAGESAVSRERAWDGASLRRQGLQILLFAVCLCLAACLFTASTHLDGTAGTGGHPHPVFLSSLVRHFPLEGPLGLGYAALAEMALATAGFAAFGFRGLLFGLGQALFLLYTLLPRFQERPFGLDVNRETVAWLVLILTGLAAFPLVRKLLGRMLPFPSQLSHALMSASMIAAFLAFPYLPARTLMQAASFLLFTGLAWTVWHGMPTPALTIAWKTTHPRTIPLIVGGALAAAIAVGWPMSDSVNTLKLSQVGPLVEKLEGLLPFLFGLGFLIRIPPESRPGSVSLRDEDLMTGAFVFAALLVGTSTTSLWLPIPFLVALILIKYRLFRPAAEVSLSGEAELNDAQAMAAYLRKAMAGSYALIKLRSALDSLDDLLLKGTLTPKDYAEKKAGLQSHFENRAEQPLPGIEDVGKPNPGAPWVFSVAGPDIRRNTWECLRVGAVLSVAPILIGIYQNLPNQTADSLFPLADCALYLAAALLYWLVLVCFFGIFFPYLRGRTGLTKGAQFAVLIVIPSFVLRVLEAQDFSDMRPLILWSMQILGFMSLLGLLAGDWRLLKTNGLRPRNLLLVHNLPFLSAYASVIIAALVSGVAALVQGKLKDLFGFFLDKITRD